MKMTFEEVRAVLQQRFPYLLVDCVLELEEGRRIKTLKNVTGNEIQFLGHFPQMAIMPATLIIEALGQSAVILFRQTNQGKTNGDDLEVLGMVDQMRFLAPVLPGDTIIMEVTAMKMTPTAAIVEVIARVGDLVVATGRLGFAKKSTRQGSCPRSR
jgi:3-hydroxyacyl-[acyl-carrier-protein] dehydratase